MEDTPEREYLDNTCVRTCRHCKETYLEYFCWECKAIITRACWKCHKDTHGKPFGKWISDNNITLFNQDI